MSAAKIKLGDRVRVIAGTANGHEGTVTAIDRKKNTVVVQDAKKMKKSEKKSGKYPDGGIIEMDAPIDLSNVMVLSDGKVSRVGFRMENGKKVRYAKATGKTLG